MRIKSLYVATLAAMVSILALSFLVFNQISSRFQKLAIDPVFEQFDELPVILFSARYQEIQNAGQHLRVVGAVPQLLRTEARCGEEASQHIRIGREECECLQGNRLGAGGVDRFGSHSGLRLAGAGRNDTSWNAHASAAAAK